MTRLLLAMWLLQQSPTSPEPVYEEPPEEDEAFREEEYVFNPIQAEEELKVGNFYFKKGSFKAAELRFVEATRWNPASVDAWMRLGEVREKLGDNQGVRQAYGKVLELAPDHREAKKLRERLARLPSADSGP